MGDPLADLGLVDRGDLRQIAAVDDARREKQFWIFAVVHWVVAVGHVIPDARADRCPIFVERRNRQYVREVDAADEVAAVGDQLLQGRDGAHVERRLRIGIDRGRHAADEETLQVGILAAQDGVYPNEAPL